MPSSAKVQAIDWQELQRHQALQRLGEVARKQFPSREEAEAFKLLVLSREVFIPVKGLTKQENRALYREWQRLKKETNV